MINNFAIETELRKRTRSYLRDTAKQLGVERGQNKHDTIRNLIRSGKVQAVVSLSFDEVNRNISTQGES